MRDIKFLLVILCMVTLLVACGENMGKEVDLEKESIEMNLEDFEKISIKLGKDNLEKLVVDGSEILKKSCLNIVNIKDDNIYGFGYGPSGDGSKTDAIFKLGFDGSSREEINRDLTISILPNLLDRDENNYYYWEFNPSDEYSELIKVDLDNLAKSKLCKLDTGLLDPLFINEDYLYYGESDFENDKNIIYKYNLKTGEKEEITPKLLKESKNRLFLISFGLNDKTQYFRDYDSETEKGDTYEYNLEENLVTKIYEDDFLDIIDINEEYSLFQNHDKNKILIWNQDKNEFAYEINIEEGMETKVFKEDRYILIDSVEDRLINLLDLKEKTNRIIDYSYLLDDLGDGQIVWKLDAGKLYIQWIDAYDLKDDFISDRIYRFELN